MKKGIWVNNLMMIDMELIKPAIEFNFCCKALDSFLKEYWQIDALRIRCERLGVSVFDEEMARIKKYASTLPSPSFDTIASALNAKIEKAKRDMALQSGKK